jgi:hypothetical protein
MNQGATPKKTKLSDLSLPKGDLSLPKGQAKSDIAMADKPKMLAKRPRLVFILPGPKGRHYALLQNRAKRK